MNRDQILTEIKKFFKVKELVCNHIYMKWGESSWQFLDTDFLHALLIVRRDILKAGMVCNNSTMTQRGIRCNCCDLVKNKPSVYMSAHNLGKGGDFTISGMTAEQARQKIKSSAHLLPCNVRIEGGVTWLHIDVLPQTGITQKVYEFKV
jgi:hypothetical protein